MPTEPDAAAFNVIERSPHYFLSRDDDGFALWSVKGDDAGPVLTFPADDDGEARARAAFKRARFGTWAQVFLVAAFVSAAAWIVAELIVQSLILFSSQPRLPVFGDESLRTVEEIRKWGFVMDSLANTSFMIAVGLSVVIWLHRRYRREG